MNELLARVLDAHGGMDRWNNYQKVGATIVTRGGPWSSVKNAERPSSLLKNPLAMEGA
jgi:hypothetical protein